MDQNEQLIGLILANQARLEAAEERLAGTATAAPPETGDATLSTTPTAGTSAMPTTAAETGQSVLSTQPNMSLTVSGHVNRALLFVDDGTDDGSDNDKQVFNVDNDNSATRFQILGRAEIDESTGGGRDHRRAVRVELHSGHQPGGQQIRQRGRRAARSPARIVV